MKDDVCKPIGSGLDDLGVRILALVGGHPAPGGGGGGGGPTYNRSGAVEYARKFWNVPCDDLFICTTGGDGFTKTPDGTTFVHESDSDGEREHALLPSGSTIPWARLDDCTHFISCCIGQRPHQTTGGLPITYEQLGEPPSDPYGIVRVSTMVDYLTGKLVKKVQYGKFLAEKSEDDSLVEQIVSNQLQQGDIIAYFSKARKIYSHMALYLGDGKIACHTYCRSDDSACTWDNSWKLGVGTHQWSVIQFIV